MKKLKEKNPQKISKSIPWSACLWKRGITPLYIETHYPQTNGIESFWRYAKRRLARFNGVRQEHFLFHLKETEFRFNHRNDNLYSMLLKRLRYDPI